MYILMLKHAAYIFVHFIGVLCSNDNVAKWKNSNSQYLVYFLILSQFIAVSTWYLLHMTAQKRK